MVFTTPFDMQVFIWDIPKICYEKQAKNTQQT